MKTGKIPENVLKRSVLKKLTVKRPEVLVHSGIGEDCSVLQAGNDAIVLSTDPITGTAKDIGKLAFHVTANDIASSGAELIGILLTIIFPPDSSEEELKEIMSDVSELAEAHQVEILGGHTEVSAAVKQTLVSVTGVGRIAEERLVTTGGLKAGHDIVVTKWIGLEGTSILAKEKGGIFGALWEMASASGVGLEIDLKRIPVRQETIEVCEVFDINPYMLISSGAMLIGTPHGSCLIEKLKRAGIHGAVVGCATAGKDRVVLNGEERRFLEPPKTDELFRVL